MIGRQLAARGLFRGCIGQTTAIRSIYLHTGKRVAGLRRDPEEVFVTAGGVKYGASDANLQHIKGFLADKYAIDDDLALQVLTHKSFANGIKPHNEKLSAMGAKALNWYAAKYVIDKPTASEMAVNGKNLDSLGSPIAKELAGRMALGVFAKINNLNAVMFWTSYNHDLSFENSGDMKVSAQMVYALVGAVTYIHGKQAAEEFIRTKLLGASPSLEEVAAQILEQGNQ